MLGDVPTYVCNGTNATRPDGPCFDDTNRYVNCKNGNGTENGTVTDTVTGLIWLKDAACLGSAQWSAANGAAAALANGQCGLTDKSSPGDWRLPTKDEWSATIARAVALGCTYAKSPSLTNDAGTACYNIGPSSFAGVVSDTYWLSTANETDPARAWNGVSSYGDIFNYSKDHIFLVWPVRGGSR